MPRQPVGCSPPTDMSCAIRRSWWNSLLSASCNWRVTNLLEEVRPGVLPNMLLEVLTDAEPGEIKYNARPTLRFHQLENMNSFLKEVGGTQD